MILISMNEKITQTLQSTREKLQRPKESLFKRIAKLMTHRFWLGSVMLLIQLSFYVLVVRFFQRYFLGIYVALGVLALTMVLDIVAKQTHPDYRTGWLLAVLLMPVFGGLFYLFFGTSRITKRERKRLIRISTLIPRETEKNRRLVDSLTDAYTSAGNQSRYILRTSGCPPHVHTRTEYLPSGERYYERLLEELKKAEKYIFLEYFIVMEGTMWNSVLAILEEKAAQGVDVRVLYDDIGSLFTLPKRYAKTLEEKGIACAPFNPFVPVVSLRLNNRDHRKICIIDGKVGFTGGLNLSDEYINQWERFGHWKDSGILLEGEAVWSFVVMFLSNWDFTTAVEEDFERFRPDADWVNSIKGDGIVQPYDSSPLAKEPVGAGVYMNLLAHAKRYLYVTTPYLILDDAMTGAFRRAAQCGVDVRIITPGIPDKRLVFEMTRANYAPLLEAGVRIYEYTPGFIHAKTFVMDDEYGVVGTINLDYRSLYLHFENGVWMCGSSAIESLKENFLETLEVCQEIHYADAGRIGAMKRLLRTLLRFIAPLL